MTDSAKTPRDDSQAIVPTTITPEITAAIKDLPAPKQQEIVHSIKETIVAAITRGGPQLDPETARIVAASLDKDNENKFKYLTQKQADSAAQDLRRDNLAADQHRDLVKPLVWTAIIVTLAAIGSGIGFIAMGRDAIGSGILSGTLGALFGFLGGFGVGKNKKE